MNFSLSSLDGLRPNPEWGKLAIFDRKKWKPVRLGGVVGSLNETEHNPSETGIERFIGLEHLDPGSLHVQTWGKVTDGTTFTRRCRPGQVLFGKRRAYQRKVAVAEFDAVVSGDIYVLAPKNDRLLPELLPFLCMSERFFQHAVGTSAGSLSPRTNWTSLASFEFDLPPLNQQRSIAEILWAVDELFRRQEKLALAIHQEITARQEAVFSAAKRTEAVGDLFEVQLGKMLSPKSKQGNSPLPYLANRNVQWGYFDLDTVQEMDFSVSEFQKFRLEPGDLLVCEGGEVGRSAIWEGKIRDCCFQKAIHRLRPRDKRIANEYMLEFMIWSQAKGLFSSLTGHSTIAHLTAVKLKRLLVPVVSSSQQEAFLKKIRDLRGCARMVQESQDRIAQLRGELLNIFGGKT